MNALNLLIEARGRIARGWVKGTFAKTASGLQCNAWDGAARQWCALGAMQGAAGGALNDTWLRAQDGAAYDYLTQAVPNLLQDVMSYNDDPNTRHCDVLHLFDRAIDACRNGEPVQHRPPPSASGWLTAAGWLTVKLDDVMFKQALDNLAAVQVKVVHLPGGTSPVEAALVSLRPEPAVAPVMADEPELVEV